MMRLSHSIHFAFVMFYFEKIFKTYEALLGVLGNGNKGIQGGHWSGNLIFLLGQGKVREFCRLVREI